MYFLQVILIALSSTLVLGKIDCEELILETNLTTPINGKETYCLMSNRNYYVCDLALSP